TPEKNIGNRPACRLYAGSAGRKPGRRTAGAGQNGRRQSDSNTPRSQAQSSRQKERTDRAPERGDQSDLRLRGDGAPEPRPALAPAHAGGAGRVHAAFPRLPGKNLFHKVDLYEGEKISFGRETIDGDFAQVESTVTNLKNEPSSVVYRLRRSGGQWKVYDAVVENISIVNHYRAQFDRVIAKSSYEDLKKMLKDKAG